MVWFSWLGITLQGKKLPVQFPAGARAWVAGLVLDRGVSKRPLTDVSLSHLGQRSRVQVKGETVAGKNVSIIHCTKRERKRPERIDTLRSPSGCLVLVAVINKKITLTIYLLESLFQELCLLVSVSLFHLPNSSVHHAL